MSDIKPLDDENSDPEDQRSFDEKLKDNIKKYKPYINSLWVNKKNFIVFNFSVFIITILYLLFLSKPYYISSVSILPEYGSKTSTLSQLSGLASIAGVNLGDNSPIEIYQKLLLSEMVLSDVIYANYKTENFTDSVNLIKYFGIENSDNNPEIRKREDFLSVYDNLTKGRIVTDIDRMTKILTVRVTMPEAQLSADVANKLVESLDQYIRTQRKSNVTEQSFFLEKRTNQIKDSLTVAENQLKNFREQNRIVAQSPRLILEQGRLMRNVEILQTVYIELTKQLELVKLDKIKDAPVLNIEELAKNPIKKAGPKRANSLFLIMFLSIVLSAFYFMFKEKFKNYLNILRENY